MSNILSEPLRSELSEIVTQAVTASLSQREGNQSMSLDKLMDKNQVCEYLGVSLVMVDSLLREGKLNPVVIGERSKRFRLSEINTYLETTRRAV